MGIFYSRERGRFSMRTMPNRQPGIVLFIGGAEENVSDDEIPGLISALQDYMSRRAREMTRAAARECGICRDVHPPEFRHVAPEAASGR